MNCKSILFDLDGTLLDSLDDLADAVNSVLLNRGFPVHPTEAYRFFVGDGLFPLIQRAVPIGISEDVVRKCCEEFAFFYNKCWHTKSTLYSGIMEMLLELSREGVILGILSNKPDGFTQTIVKHFFPNNPFGYVAGHKEDIAKKPDPAGALYAAQRLGVLPEATFFVGDTAIDIQTGKNAGMKTIGVTWGFRPETELLANNADKIVYSPKEIIDYVRISS